MGPTSIQINIWAMPGGPSARRVLPFITAAQAGRHREVMDRRVREEVGVEVLDEAAELVMRCLSMVGEERPTMKEVADKLHSLIRSSAEN